MAYCLISITIWIQHVVDWHDLYLLWSFMAWFMTISFKYCIAATMRICSYVASKFDNRFIITSWTSIFNLKNSKDNTKILKSIYLNINLGRPRDFCHFIFPIKTVSIYYLGFCIGVYMLSLRACFHFMLGIG